MWVIGFGILLAISLALVFGGGADRRIRLIRAGVALAVGTGAIGAYAIVGKPGLPGQPFADRAAELAARDPSQMSSAELLVRLQTLTREQPTNPEPHFFIGQMLRGEGRIDDAIRAYQSALRRDSGYVPAMIGLADAYVENERGKVSQGTAAIYAEAFRLDVTKVRAGFMVGLSQWQAGDREAAYAVWEDVRAEIPAGDQREQMLDALIAAAEESGAG